MSLTAKDYDEEDAAIAAAVAEAANDSHIIATLKKFYELEQPDKLAIGLHAINGMSFVTGVGAHCNSMLTAHADVP